MHQSPVHGRAGAEEHLLQLTLTSRGVTQSLVEMLCQMCMRVHVAFSHSAQLMPSKGPHDLSSPAKSLNAGSTMTCLWLQ